MVSDMRDDRIKELLGLVARAAGSGDVDAVLDLTDVLQRWHASKQRSETEGSQVGNVMNTKPAVGSRKLGVKGSKAEDLAWARSTRQSYVSKNNLTHVSRSAYVSPSGSSVGIAASRWRSSEPNCFLGLSESGPSGEWDVVVLLCELEGRLLDFVIPMEKISGVWTLLSRNGRHVKIHVQRREGQLGQYEMQVPSRVPVDLREFFSETAVF